MANIPSIEMTPSACKSGKVYSVLPSDGSADFNFARASEATRVNENGLIETVGSNVPRIDYTDGGCPSLLLEPLSTNLITYSEDFSQWSKEATVTLTPNYGISPDGTQNSTRMQMNEDDSIYVSASSGLTASFYVKGTQGETIRLSNGSSTTHTLTGNWDRIETYDSSSVSSLISINTYSGATARDIEIWGAQAEALSYPTSYIPTSGATATRVAETASKANISNLIGQTEGVLFAEVSAFDNTIASNRKIVLGDGSFNNGVEFSFKATTNKMQFIIRSGGTISMNIETTAFDVTEFNKIAIHYKPNEGKVFVNGNQISVTNTSVVSPIGLSRLDLKFSTAFEFEGKVKDLRVYNTALTDQELIALTS